MKAVSYNCAKYWVCVCYFHPHKSEKVYEEMYMTLLRLPQRNKEVESRGLIRYTGEVTTMLLGNIFN